ncbi:phosphomevalonate kinase [Zootermopsis nevadensis]|uniref:Phosphomevalonate kinase n=1 Tax=Zootermopsis nevadensis TaxID=136037 RepID=A0A067QIK8_ZOONE|nr:phosphomevalonate kinase [Zootermopsis nevadensis]KDR07077.1 Phosphomevalonate kinase [Zootermopsis nevadensis]
MEKIKERLAPIKFPVCILLFSGKRKSGKDYITDRIFDRLGKDNAAMIKISAPIKTHWAEKHDLNFEELMGTGEYKEKHRQDMIKWSEDIRQKDCGYFCQAAVEMFNAHEKPVWIVSDTRRRSDLKWFKENYGNAVKTVRVLADDDVRTQRGWVFTTGIDDAETECDLDGLTDWDWSILNNGSEPELENGMQNIVSWVNSTLSL